MLERWTELFGYHCISKRGPRIFIRDLLPTLNRASFLSDLPSFLLAAAAAPQRLLNTGAHAPSALPRLSGSGQKKRDAACSFSSAGKSQVPGALPSSHSSPHAPCPMPACRMPSGAAR